MILLSIFLGWKKLHSAIMISLYYLGVKIVQWNYDSIVFCQKSIFGIMLKGTHVGSVISNFRNTQVVLGFPLAVHRL